MRRSRRPGAARSRCAGKRNGARRWPRPDRNVPYPGCANEPRPGPAAEPGLRGAGVPRTAGPGHRGAARRCGPAGTGRRAQRRGPPGGRRRAPAPGMPGRKPPGRGRRPDPPARNWTGPAKTPDGRPRSARMPRGTKPDRQRRPEPRSRRQRTPAPGLKPARHAEAELQRARADRDQTAGRAGLGQPTGPTRRRRSPGNLATSNYQRSTSRSGRSPLRSTTMSQPFRSAAVCAPPTSRSGCGG